MLRCSVVQRGALCVTRSLRVRRAHAGVRQAWAVMERQVLVEEAMAQPAPVRAAQGSAGSHVSAHTAAYLRDLAECAETVSPGADARDMLHSAATSGTQLANAVEGQRAAVVADAGGAIRVASLSEFLAECKRHRIAIGNAREQGARNKMRTAFREFWATHIGSAVRCCAHHGRDVGFLASHGLADTALHLPVAAMGVALDALLSELAVSSALDVCSTLHYLARELDYVERRQPRRRAALGRLRRVLTDVAVERFVFFFVQHAPRRPAARPAAATFEPLTADDASQTSESLGASVATAEDALQALETLSYLRVGDASPGALRATCESVQHYAAAREMAMTTQLHAWPNAGGETVVATLLQDYLVACAFDLIALQRGQLRFTSLVQAFALLRIFLPRLWPPHESGGEGRSVGGGSQLHRRREAGARRAARERLLRLTWALARELRRRDAQLVNPYHFVKIATTLARLPAFVLVPAAAVRADKTYLFSLTLPQLEADGAGTASVGDGASAGHFLPPAVFWHYVVSKACIFVPALPPAQRRVVCYALDVAIRQKRGRCLGQPETATAPAAAAAAVYDTHLAHRTSRAPLGDSAEDILLPLKQAMQSYEENFEHSVMLGARGRARD